MNQPTPNPDLWDNDPVTREVSDRIRSMPDLPPVVVALLIRDRAKDEVIKTACREMDEAFLDFIEIESFGFYFGVCFLALHPDTAVNPCVLLEKMATLPYYEAAIYVGGVARARVAAVVRRPPVQDIFSEPPEP
jgi:hypothetical protein